MYVDDLVSEERTEKGAYELYEKAKSRMGQQGFRLRRWLTNDKVLRERIELHEKCQSSEDREQSLGEQESCANLYP